MTLGLLLALGCSHPRALPAAESDPTLSGLRASIEASSDDAWQRLAYLCDTIGHRHSGSSSLEESTRWAEAELQADGLRAWREAVQVPVWRRGEASLRIVRVEPSSSQGGHAQTPPDVLPVLALGGSVAARGIEAAVIVLGSFEELGPEVAGKIVLFEHPMRVTDPAIDGYGEAAAFRSRGAIEAAKHGAVAVLVRSVTTRSLATPHTGAMGYDDAVPRIPAAAVSTEAASWLRRQGERGVSVTVRLDLGTTTEPDAESHNVVAELPGRGPGVVVIGAHIDSWDVGQGAHDDGAGVVEVMEAMRHLKRVGATPEATIRAVLFTNEEFGLRGGRNYADTHGAEPHWVAMETDLGGGAPEAFSATGSPEALKWLQGRLLPLGLEVVREGGGADIGPLGERGVLVAGLLPDDSHYFDVHHTEADTIDKVDPDALRTGVWAVAAFAWLTASASAGPPPGKVSAAP